MSIGLNFVINMWSYQRNFLKLILNKFVTTLILGSWPRLEKDKWNRLKRVKDMARFQNIPLSKGNFVKCKRETCKTLKCISTLRVKSLRVSPIFGPRFERPNLIQIEIYLHYWKGLWINIIINWGHMCNTNICSISHGILKG